MLPLLKYNGAVIADTLEYAITTMSLVFRLAQWTGYKGMKNIKYVIEMKEGTIKRYILASGRNIEFQDI